jgi:PST family polysaccharide transporter
LVNVALGIARTKAMAVFLGPAGFGLMGALTSIADLMRSVAELGINSSGVRQIAEAAGTRDTSRIALTARVLRYTAILLGVIGALLTLLLSGVIAKVTFGSTDNIYLVALLAPVVLLRLVGDGHSALVQGLRRIGDLAKLGILGSLIGTLISVPLIYWLREDGIAWSLIAGAGASTLVAWWYGRNIELVPVKLTRPLVTREISELLKLGLAFLASGLLTVGASYAVRLLVVRYDGLQGAGLYQASWTLGSLYVAFVLQAMAADFYPRLVSAVTRHAECNHLVNEQAHVSLLMAAPGVVATLAFAPAVLHIFYSGEFVGATDTLRWIDLGMALRVITWPIGYVIVAKGTRRIFFAVELAWAIVNIGTSWILVSFMGVVGAGIAFFASYVFHGVVVYGFVWRMTGFRWSCETLKAGIATLAATGAVFCNYYVFSHGWALALNALILVAITVYAVHSLLSVNAPNLLTRRLQQLRLRLL